MPENVGYPDPAVSQQIQQEQQAQAVQQQAAQVEVDVAEQQVAELETPAAEPIQVETTEPLQAEPVESPEQVSALLAQTSEQISSSPDAAIEAQAHVTAEEVLGL